MARERQGSSWPLFDLVVRTPRLELRLSSTSPTPCPSSRRGRRWSPGAGSGRTIRFRLGRDDWERRRRSDIEIAGLEGCLDMFLGPDA